MSPRGREKQVSPTPIASSGGPCSIIITIGGIGCWLDGLDVIAILDSISGPKVINFFHVQHILKANKYKNYQEIRLF